MSSVAHFISNVLAVAIGSVLADAVEWAVTQFKELITGSIEIANQFQALEIRLKQLNFNDAITAGKDYTTAMEEATAATKEELICIQKLAFKTPFEMEDITNVYGLARAFGYTDNEARDLTETLGDFIFGMGLTGDAANSVVKQFGQMTNNGKIMQKNLNALAQGGLVPVTKLLDTMREKTGLSEAEFKKFLLTAEGVTMFKETFSKFVEDNFAGAGERANRTFKNATITLKEFFQTLLAGNVVTPIIASIGETIAKTNDALQARLPDIQAAFGRIGTVISDIITELTGNVDFTSFADGFVKGLNSIASWLEGHKGDIVNFFKGGYDYITGTLIPKLQELKDWFFGTPDTKTTTTKTVQRGGNEADITSTVTNADKSLKVLQDMQPLVQPVKDLFDSLLKVGLSLMGISFGDLSEKSFADNVLKVADGLERVAKFIDENAESIASLIKGFATFLLVMEGIKAFVIIVLGLISVWTIVSLVIQGAIWLFGLLATVVGLSIIPILLLAAGIAWVGYMWNTHGEEMKTTVSQLGFLIGYWFDYAKTKIIDWATDTWVSIIMWGINTWKTIKKWGSDTAKSISDWVDNANQKFADWRDGVISTFVAWKDGVVAKVQEAVSSTLATMAGWLTSAVAKAQEIKDGIVKKFTDMLAAIKATVGQIKAAIVNALQSALDGASSINFINVGYNIATSIAHGILSGAYSITQSLKKAVQDALDAANNLLHIGSPSKVMIDMGKNIDSGLAIGISQFSGMVSSAMAGMAQNMMGPISVMPQMASAAASNITTTNTNNYNLAINSNSRSEPIIQDFEMMRSLSS
jgi:tape measure domain-containing protein